MAGFVEVDVRRVVTGLGRMSKAAKDLSKPFRKFRPDLRTDLDEHFADKVQPDGTWPAWSDSYYQKMLRKPRMVLKKAWRRKNPLHFPGAFTFRGARRFQQMLGRLQWMLKWTIDRHELSAASRVPWAHTHQWGREPSGRSWRIPQRMFLWASEEAIAKLVVILQDYVLLAWWS